MGSDYIDKVAGSKYNMHSLAHAAKDSDLSLISKLNMPSIRSSAARATIGFTLYVHELYFPSVHTPFCALNDYVLLSFVGGYCWSIYVVTNLMVRIHCIAF